MLLFPLPGSASLALVFSPRQNVTFPAQLKCQMLCEAFPSIFSSVLTAPLQTPESVMKMMMISKLITANTVEHSLCARRCSKLFSCINAFNPHKDSRWRVLYHPHFVDGESRPREVKSSAQGCTAGEWRRASTQAQQCDPEPVPFSTPQGPSRTLMKGVSDSI